MAKSVPTKPRLVIIGKTLIPHFKTAAARVAAGNAETLGRDGGRCFEMVEVKIATAVYEPKEARAPRKPLTPQRFGFKRSADDFASFAIDLAQANPKGFRQPSTKAKKWFSTSLVEQAAIRAGHMEPGRPELSARGERNRTAYDEMKAAITAERETGIDPKYLSASARRRLASAELKLAAE